MNSNLGVIIAELPSNNMGVVPNLLNVLILVALTKSSSGVCPVTSGKADYSNGSFRGGIVQKSNFLDCKTTTGIVHLDLSRNTIHTITNNSFDYFPTLKVLNISHNNISKIELGVLIYLRNMNIFDASYNSLIYVNDNLFTGLININAIRLDNNEIYDIGATAFHSEMAYLEDVNMSHNRLTAMEPWPFIPIRGQSIDGTNLDFDVTYNEIEFFTNKMSWTYNLKDNFNSFNIMLQHNKLKRIDSDVLRMYNPYYSGDLITEYATYQFNVSINPFVCDCEMYEIAEAMHTSIFENVRIEENRIRCGTPDHLAGQDFMHDIALDQFVCNITQDCPTGCFCQERPLSSELFVDCTHANLAELPQTLPIPKYGNISLHLDSNHISELNFRPYMASVRNLTISNNYLVFANSSVFNSKLKHLDISGNRLQFIPKSIQIIPFSNVMLEDNAFVCACNMTWVKSWLELYPDTPSTSLTCEHDGKTIKFLDATDDKLQCNYDFIAITISICLGSVVALVLGLVIIAKRCPYETKVLAFRYFGLHPRDKYKVDLQTFMDHDAYISCDFEDIQVRQWLTAVFLRKFQDNKKTYSFYCNPLNGLAGQYIQDEIVNNLKKSRRVIVLLSPGYFINSWCEFEAMKAEEEYNSGDSSKCHVIYILWNDALKKREELLEEPWQSRLSSKTVMSPDERFFWSKLRYELPLKPIPVEKIQDRKSSNSIQHIALHDLDQEANV